MAEPNCAKLADFQGEEGVINLRFRRSGSSRRRSCTMGDPEAHLPLRSVLLEIERVRGLFRHAVANYSARFEADLDELRDKIQALMEEEKLAQARLRDIRDMLTLLRNTSVKSGKGRRKELKKLDALVADLQMLTETW